jgi:SpoVK/Ycf46/Vps4 family AAA+-type ATPase
LNQSLVNHYRQAINTKRTRPEGFDESADDSNSTGVKRVNVEIDPSVPTVTPASPNNEKYTTQEENSSIQHESMQIKSATKGKINKKTKDRETAHSSNRNTIDESRSKSNMINFQQPRPSTRLKDLAGIDNILHSIREIVFYPVIYPFIYSRLGVQPPCGILLNGPSGCGKTTLAHAIAGELGVPFFKASGPELIGGTSGESEERIRQIFEVAVANAPSVLFIDSLDVIAGKKESTQRGMDRRIIAQLFDSIDSLYNMTSEASRGNINKVELDSRNSNIKEEEAARAEEEKIKNNTGPVIFIAAANK